MTNQGDLFSDAAQSWDDDTVAVAVRELFGFAGRVQRRFDSELDQTSLLVDEHAAQMVAKVMRATTPLAEVDLEGRAARWAHDTDPDLPVAQPQATLTGELFGLWGTPARAVRLYPRLPGSASLDGITLSPTALKSYGCATARLGRALRGFFHTAAQRRSPWHVESRAEIRAMSDAIADPAGRALAQGALDRFEANVAPVWSSLRAQVVHTDLTLDNLLLEGDIVRGILDFGDLTHTALVTDVVGALPSVGSTRTGRDLLSAVALFLDGYTAITPLEPIERAVLADTLRLRLAITVTLSAARSGLNPPNATYLQSWDDAAWSMLRELDAATESEVAATFGTAPPRPSTEVLVDRRAGVFGTVLAPLSYAEPLTPIRGRGAAIEDSEGRTYIDAYNNVPVVGHAHPRVASAIADQTRLLSTNLRYLHLPAIALAERLVATLPPESGIDTVLYLNSGSEATDLAWRIAAAATGHTGALVTDFAYHGVTTATTALSPEQWRGGWSPDHVERFAAPTGTHPDPSAIDRAIGRLAGRGHRPAALFLDPTYTSDGILVPGADYHAAVGTSARRSGALVVADEVQAGFGRSGDHLWAFEGAGLVPDLITLGKPMGNGYPVAAVLARRADIEALAAQTEFFSTYGGGPVAAAAATAVLDTIRDERLVAHAGAMGARLRALLSADGHPAVVEVRGRGLLIGVQIEGVSTSVVLDRAREWGVLVGSTGPASDVIKIRPPLAITPHQVDEVADVVLAALSSAAHPRTTESK